MFACGPCPCWAELVAPASVDEDDDGTVVVAVVAPPANGVATVLAPVTVAPLLKMAASLVVVSDAKLQCPPSI